jgi:radical SAM/Cys-rich protein
MFPFERTFVMLATLPYLQEHRFPDIQREALKTLQVNLGYRCNQQCLHCHVNAGPNRSEVMDAAIIDSILETLASRDICNLDITGGAPELHERFRYLVSEARNLGVHVMDRCNLTILEEPGYEDLAAFLAEQQVEVVASLPCYIEANVDAQRGKGSYIKSISALKRLNALGYGIGDSGLRLNLVYNPQGPSLPPAQCQLEQDYRRHLVEEYGIHFTALYTLTNMPIQRFGSMLLSTGDFEPYMQLLQSAHQPDNLANVMCRQLVSVDWQGYLYDCDFNQMLELPMQNEQGQRRHLRDLLTMELTGDAVSVAGHCFGCTAGQGSSCGGALNE